MLFDYSISQLAAFIDYATEYYPINPNNLYVLGFSQGAILSMTLGLTLGNRIKGIVALSGYIPGFVKEEYNIQPVNQLSFFISHGKFDNVLPYEWGVESNVFFQGLGSQVTFQSYSEGHTISLANQQDFMKWILADLNH
jgi:phospholipase/carboxylesterase